MTRITFTVPGVPKAQPRQRHRVVTAGGRSFAQNFTPTNDPVNSFKASVRLACTRAHSGPLLDGPLFATVVFVFPRPQYLLKPKSPAERLHYTKKPDLDNTLKALLDSLNGVLYTDDAQVVGVSMSKWYAQKGEAAGVHVEVSTLGNQETALFA